ncbi:immunity 17 family protein [Bacteroides cellulosilyticus]|uniref:immunity 17 family protein n=1 Tax=Bacteroides cellulosilyticus TaxID=246787 RepID=UPI0032EB1FC3
MEWYEKLVSMITNFPELLKNEPRYGYLVVTVILFVWFVGLVLGWKWTYSRPGSWNQNFLLELLGEKGYRLFLGIVVALCIFLTIYLFNVSK